MGIKRRVIKRDFVGLSSKYVLQLQDNSEWVDVKSYDIKDAALTDLEYFRAKRVVAEEVIDSD